MFNNINKTLFGQIYFFNKQSHFQTRNSNLYYETFSIQNKNIYGIFDFKQLSKNELFTTIILHSKDKSFEIEERYRFINNIEIIKLQNFNHIINFEEIDNHILKIILHKNNKHIINCSCCHRY